MRLIRLLKQDLAHEIEEWVDDELILQDQAVKIRERYGIIPGEQFSLGYNLLVGLGFLFIGLSVITLLGANWDEIPRWVRMVGLIVLTATTHLTGIRFFKHGDSGKAVAIFFLGNFFYGASIILIAQIYHLGEHMPDGVYWWAIGCLPFAVLLRSRIIALQMMALALIWAYVETDLGFYPASFPIFAAASLYVLVRSEGSAVLFLMVFASVALWVEFTLAAYWHPGTVTRFEAEHLTVTASMFAAAYGLGHWLANRSDPKVKDYGALLGVWCLRFVILMLFVLSFEFSWAELINAKWDQISSMSIVAGCFWSLAMLFAFLTRHYFSLLSFLALFVGTTFLVILVDSDVHAITFQIIYNIHSTIIKRKKWKDLFVINYSNQKRGFRYFCNSAERK